MGIVEKIIKVGKFILGTVVNKILIPLWEMIRGWLNEVAADFIEEALGYEARNNIQRAVSMIDKKLNKLQNVSYIYTLEDEDSLYLDKTTITSEANVTDVDRDIVRAIEMENNHIEQTMEYEY